MRDSDIAGLLSLVGAANADGTVDPPVLFPPDESLLVHVVRKAAADHVPLTVVGGGTAPMDKDKLGVRLSTVKLGTVLEISPADALVRVQAGTIVDDIAGRSEAAGLAFPLEATSGADGTVGGAFMTGARGPDASPERGFVDAVIGVRAVTVTDGIVAGGGRTEKNVTGYDLPRFLAGTHGLYAVVIELTVHVRRLPPSRVVVATLLPHTADAVSLLLRSRDVVPGVTLLAAATLGEPPDILHAAIGLDGVDAVVDDSIQRLYDLLDRGGARDMTTVSRTGWMREYRRMVNRHFGPELATFSLPPAAVPVLAGCIAATAPGSPVVYEPGIGRVRLRCGDGAEYRSIRDAALAAGGTLPVAAWASCFADRFTEEEWAMVVALKRELDPPSILNPHLMR